MAKKKDGKVPKKNAVERAVELLRTPFKDTPPMAARYAHFLCQRYGGCGEVILTAFASYAQKVEGLPCKPASYRVNETDWNEFVEKDKTPKDVRKA